MLASWQSVACLMFVLASVAPLAAQPVVSSPDGRRQVTALAASGPITIDGEGFKYTQMFAF